MISEFKLPTFQEQKGEDWTPVFNLIKDYDNYLLTKIWELYKKRNVSTMQFPYINYELDKMGITYSNSDSLGTKKRLRRDFNKSLGQKGFSDIYLDIQESIVGTRGAFYSFSFIEGISDKYVLNNHMFLDVKTSDMAKVASILEIFRKPENWPAFMQIYLIYWNGSAWILLDALVAVNYFFIVDGSGNFIVDGNGNSIIQI